MIPWLVQVASQAAQYFFGHSDSTSSSDTIGVAWRLWAYLEALTKWLTGLVNNELAAWRLADQRVQSAAPNIESIASDAGRIGDQIVFTILPNTIRWTVTTIEQWAHAWLDPILALIGRQLRQLYGWVEGLQRWRQTYADPELVLWVSFDHWFHTWPLGVLNRWHDWITNPRLFVDWLLPWLTKPLVAYLGLAAQRANLDQLTAEVLDASPDVWRHAEAAAVAILLTEQ